MLVFGCVICHRVVEPGIRVFCQHTLHSFCSHLGQVFTPSALEECVGFSLIVFLKCSNILINTLRFDGYVFAVNCPLCLLKRYPCCDMCRWGGVGVIVGSISSQLYW